MWYWEGLDSSSMIFAVCFCAAPNRTIIQLGKKLCFGWKLCDHLWQKTGVKSVSQQEKNKRQIQRKDLRYFNRTHECASTIPVCTCLWVTGHSRWSIIEGVHKEKRTFVTQKGCCDVNIQGSGSTKRHNGRRLLWQRFKETVSCFEYYFWMISR